MNDYTGNPLQISGVEQYVHQNGKVGIYNPQIEKSLEEEF